MKKQSLKIKKPPLTFKHIAQQREFLLIIIIVAFAIILGFANDGFWTASNFKSMSRGLAIDGLVLIGMAYLLISGVFDISVASTMALSAYIFTSIVLSGVGLFWAFLITLAMGGTIGLFNGFLITGPKVNALIATLATQTIARGIVLAISQGKPVRLTENFFTQYSTSEIFGIPTIFILFVAIIIVLDIMLRKVRFFRQLYFVGGNPLSAELTGISVKKIRLTFYILISMLAALAGMLSASRLEGAVPNAYAGLEMKLIVACVIGGCSLDGGEGTMWGSVLGLVFLYILDNGLVMLGMDIYWFNTALGLFLILVVLMNSFSAKRTERKQKTALKQTQSSQD